MKDKHTKQSAPLSARMVEDETAERIKKRLRDMGLIVNAGVGKGDKPTGKKVKSSEPRRATTKRDAQMTTKATKKPRKDRSDITVGEMERKHGMPPGTVRNEDGRDTRSDKKLGTIRKGAAKKSGSSALRSPAATKSAAKSASLKAFQMTYDNTHVPKANRG